MNGRLNLQEHPDPQSSAILEMRDYHAESPPGSPSGSATSAHEYKRELTPVQENPNELGDGTPRAASATPRQSSLEGEGKPNKADVSGQQSKSLNPTNPESGSHKARQQKAEESVAEKDLKIAKSKAGNAARKGETDPHSIRDSVKDAVQGLKNKFGTSSDKKVGISLLASQTLKTYYPAGNLLSTKMT